MILNVDFAPTLLDARRAERARRHARPQLSAAAQGRAARRLAHGDGTTATTTTRATTTRGPHYGVRTETHKLIYFWKKDQWECYDLIHDPDELHNLAGDPAYADLVAKLKVELYRLKKEVQDNDEFAEHQPTTSVAGPPVQPRKGGRANRKAAAP